MTHPDTEKALDRAHAHADRLAGLPRRPAGAGPGRSRTPWPTPWAGDLPDEPTAAADVVDLLAGAVEPGLVAMPSGRFFGFVIGGSHPAALAADWLVGAWDQNAVLRQVTPGRRGRRGGGRGLAPRPARPARRQRRRLRDRGDHRELHGDRDRPRRAAARGRLGRVARPGRRPRRAGAGRARAARLRRPRAALRRPALPRARRGRRPGAGAAGRARGRRCGPGPASRRWCCSRRGTCTRARATRSTRASRSRTSTTRGCTSTAPSGCGRPRLRRTGTSRRASRAPTRGRPTPTRR